MARPEPTDLVLQIQNGSPEDFRSLEQRNLLQTYSSDHIHDLFQRLEKDLPVTQIDLLDKGIRSAWLGALYAFQDRELEPFQADHREVFSIIAKDIEEAYSFVSQGDLDVELWAYETFDYGIKQVYYLDWQLYLSKICY